MFSFFFSSQYVFELFFLRFNKSFLINLIIIPVGVTTQKKIAPITKGETIFPKNNPNLNHNLFIGVNIFEFITPNIKKIIEITKDHNLISALLINGHKATIKKNKKKTIPKLLLELILILFFINIYY